VARVRKSALVCHTFFRLVSFSCKPLSGSLMWHTIAATSARSASEFHGQKKEHS
jgi:hypothetical protein